MGQPAYARPPRPVDVKARPLDPDDLPILAEMTDDERELAARILGSASDGSAGPTGHLSRGRLSGLKSSPVRLRALAGKLLGG
jgi:hypothetical protein